MRYLTFILSPVFVVVSGTGFIDSSPAQAEEFPVSQRTLQQAGMSSQPIVLQHYFDVKDNAAIAQAADSPPASPTPSVPISYAPIPTQVNGSFTGGNGAGFEQSFFGLDGFIPLTQTSGQDLTFLQGRLLLSTDGDPGGNVILGYRRFAPTNNAILGAYIGYDVRDSGRATFNQLGAGVEGIWPGFEVRVNGYLPIGDTRQSVDRQSFTSTSTSTSTNTTATPTGALRFLGNFLAVDVARTTTSTTTTNTLRIDRRQDEIALGGFDAEAGVKLAQWQPDGDLRSYLGLYYYSGSNVGGFVGVRGRLVARINQYASIGASIQGDPEFGTTGAVTVSLQFPGMSRRATTDATTNWARMGDSVNRSNTVAITERTRTRSSTISNTSTSSSVTATSLEAALNPATGQPYIFEHVVLGLTGGDGSFENPLGIVADALVIVPTDGNGIVYVQPGSNPGIPAFTIPNNVQVLSTGPVQTLPTVQYGVTQLPLSGAGVLPGVTNTITMGNNTVLSGFAIAPPTGNPGILAPGVQTVTIRDNRVQATGDNTAGISLQNMTGIATISNNAISTNGNTTVGAGGAHAIAVNASTATLSTLAITDNTLATVGSGNQGLLLFAENTGRIDNATLARTTVNINSTNGGGGIAVRTNQGGQVGTVNLTSTTISTTGNGARGLAVEALNRSTIGTVTATGTIINTTGNGAPGVAVRADNNSTINGATVAGSTITTQGIAAAGVLINPNAGSIATVALSDNTLTTNGDAGFGINVSPGNAGQIGNIAINNNRITPQSPTARFGIFLDTQSNPGSSIATSTLSQNTITATGNTIGIELRLRQSAVPFQTTISNNVIQAGSSGILLVSDQTDGTATISGNTITRASSSGISVSPSSASGIVRAVVDNNTIANVSLALGFQYGINLSANDGSQLFGTVTNNRVSNTNAFVSPSQVEYRFFSNNGSGILPNLCVQVLNNSASNSGYLFQQFAGSVLRREPLVGNTGTAQPDVGTITNVAAGTCGF